MSLILGILDSGGAAAGGGTSYESIATVTVGSGGAADIQFTSIPSTYTHLQIRTIGRSSNSANNGISMRIQLNSDTGSNYSQHYLGTFQGASSATESVGAANTSSIYIGTIPDNNIMADLYAGTIIDILDYKNTNKYKTLRALSGYDFNGATSGYSYLNLHSGNWRNTNAITSIKLFGAAGNFMQYSQFALYGIKGS
jgi:hypothetical protein